MTRESVADFLARGGSITIAPPRKAAGAGTPKMRVRAGVTGAWLASNTAHTKVEKAISAAA